MKTFRVMVAGSRDFVESDEDRSVILDALWTVMEGHPGPIEVIHGDCRGADKTAAKAAADLGIGTITPYPADWKTYGKQAGFVRNQQMVDTKPDLVLAFHLNGSNGTQDAIDRAQAAGISVRLMAKRTEELSNHD